MAESKSKNKSAAAKKPQQSTSKSAPTRKSSAQSGPRTSGSVKSKERTNQPHTVPATPGLADEGGYCIIISGEHKGRRGVYRETTSFNEDGTPDEIVVDGRDDQGTDRFAVKHTDTQRDERGFL